MLCKDGKNSRMAAKNQPSTHIQLDEVSSTSRIADVSYRAILDGITQGILILQGRPYKVVFANNSISKISGFSISELLSFKIEDIIGLIHSDDLKIVFQLFQDIRESNPIPNQFVFRGYRSDETIVWLELSVSYVEYKGEPAVLASFLEVSERMQAKQTVRESERKFRQIVESSPLGMHMYELESDGRLIFIGANPAADNLLNVDHQVLAGKTIEEAFPSLSTTEIPDRYREVALSGTSWSSEQVDFNDETIRGAFEVHAFQTEPGKMAASFLDITARKEAEQEVRDSEKKHRTLVQSMEDLVFVFDKDNNYAEYYSASGHLLYVQPELLLGKHVSEILPLDVAYMFIIRTRRVRETRQPETFDYELVINGTSHWFSATLGIHEDRERVVCVVRDITHQRIAQERIRQQHDFLERVIESLTHPFYVIDVQDYTIKTANKATGFPRSDATRTCYALTHHRSTPCTGDDHPCPIQEVIRTKKPVVLEHTHFDSNGNVRYHLVHGYPIFDSAGNIIQMIEYNTDITEQRWAEKQLETQSKRARLYLDLLAHDMANQLQIIAGSMELLREFLGNNETQLVDRFLCQIEESLQKCKSTISKARSTEQLATVTLFELSLLEVLRNCIENIRRMNDCFALEIAEDIGDATILADCLLEDLLTILLENAIKHNPDETRRVWVELRPGRNGYEVSISDNGPGINDTIKRELFDSEHRFGGLGLHFSKEAVEKYGGSIEVSDRIDGMSELGVEFLVWLPAIGDLKNE